MAPPVKHKEAEPKAEPRALLLQKNEFLKLDRGLLEQARNLFERKGPAFLEKPFVYVGSGCHEEYPLLLDGRTCVLIDPIYAGKGTEVIKAFRKRLTNAGIDCKEQQEGILDKGGKHIFEFEFEGRPRKYLIYAEDATKFTPTELKEGPSVFIVPRRGLAVGPEELSEMIAHLPMGSIFDVWYTLVNYKIVKYVPIEMLGLRPLQTSPHQKHCALMEKREQIEKERLRILLEIDNKLSWARKFRRGDTSLDYVEPEGFEKEIGWRSKEFSKQLKSIKSLLEGLDEETALKLKETAEQVLYLSPGEPVIRELREIDLKTVKETPIRNTRLFEQLIRAYNREYERVFGEAGHENYRIVSEIGDKLREAKKARDATSFLKRFEEQSPAGFEESIKKTRDIQFESYSKSIAAINGLLPQLEPELRFKVERMTHGLLYWKQKDLEKFKVAGKDQLAADALTKAFVELAHSFNQEYERVLGKPEPE